MFCKTCGAENREDAVFCEKCGAKLEEQEISAAVENSGAGLSEKTVSDESTAGIAADVSEAVSDKQTSEEAESPAADETVTPVGNAAADVCPAPKKKGHGAVIAIVSVCAVLLIAVAAFLAVTFMGKSTAEVLDEAVEKTFEQADSFIATAAFRSGDTNMSMDIKFELDEDSVNFSTSFMGGDILLYDGILVISSDGTVISATDISEDLEEALSADVNGKETIDEDMIRSIYDAMTESYGASGEDIPPIDDVLDVKKAVEAANALQKDLYDDDYLTENYGLTVEKNGDDTNYVFKVNLYSAIQDFVERFESCAKDRDDFDEMKSMIEDEKASLDTVITLTFVVNDGYFSSLITDMIVEGTPISVSLSFSDFGKAEIDEDSAVGLCRDAKELLGGNKTYSIYDSYIDDDSDYYLDDDSDYYIDDDSDYYWGDSLDNDVYGY